MKAFRLAKALGHALLGRTPVWFHREVEIPHLHRTSLGVFRSQAVKYLPILDGKGSDRKKDGSTPADVPASSHAIGGLDRQKIMEFVTATVVPLAMEMFKNSKEGGGATQREKQTAKESNCASQDLPSKRMSVNSTGPLSRVS